jgi:hypothetical protein
MNIQFRTTTVTALGCCFCGKTGDAAEIAPVSLALDDRTINFFVHVDCFRRALDPTERFILDED